MEEVKGWWANLPNWAKWGLGAIAVGALIYLAYKLYQSRGSSSSSVLPNLGSTTTGTPLSLPAGGASGGSSTAALTTAQDTQLASDISSLTSAVNSLGSISTRTLSPQTPAPNYVTQEPTSLAMAQETVAKTALPGSIVATSGATQAQAGNASLNVTPGESYIPATNRATGTPGVVVGTGAGAVFAPAGSTLYQAVTKKAS